METKSMVSSFACIVFFSAALIFGSTFLVRVVLHGGLYPGLRCSEQARRFGFSVNLNGRQSSAIILQRSTLARSVVKMGFWVRCTNTRHDFVTWYLRVVGPDLAAKCFPQWMQVFLPSRSSLKAASTLAHISLSLSSSCVGAGLVACEMFRLVPPERETDDSAACEAFWLSWPSWRDVVRGVVREPRELPSPRLFLWIPLAFLPREIDIVFVCLSRTFSFPSCCPRSCLSLVNLTDACCQLLLVGSSPSQQLNRTGTQNLPACGPVFGDGVAIPLYCLLYHFYVSVEKENSILCLRPAHDLRCDSCPRWPASQFPSSKRMSSTPASCCSILLLLNLSLRWRHWIEKKEEIQN